MNCASLTPRSLTQCYADALRAHIEILMFIDYNEFEVKMPTISMFFGIIIRIYTGTKEHNPPHIHVYYQDERASFDINSGNLIDGKMPNKQTRLVQAWIELHREELLADWILAQKGEKPFNIEPLK
jgi:hypothetical protein